jgi:hypothetical protein
MDQKKSGVRRPPNIKAVYKIPIDVDGKQIIIVRGVEMNDDDKKHLAEHLQSWMKSDDPATVLFVGPEVVINVTKVRHHKRKGTENVGQESD